MTFEHKITLIGPIPYDHVTTWNNETYSKYGCLIYPSIALSSLFGKSARITPISHVRQRDKQAVKTILKGHPGIELLRINSDLDQGDEIQLQFINKNKCLEKQYGFMNPIVPDDVKHVLDSDFFLFVPVTDFEITLETLEFVKTYSESTIIFGAQSSTMAVTVYGDRVSKFWVDRDLWLPNIDILVMTLEQAKYSWFKKEYTLEQLEDLEDLDDNALQDFASYCFEKGVKALYILLDDEGCIVHYEKDGEVCQKHILNVEAKDSIYITDRMESFIAGLTFGLIYTDNDYEKAAYFANVIGVQRTLGIYGKFSSAEETIKIVQENYGDI